MPGWIRRAGRRSAGTVGRSLRSVLVLGACLSLALVGLIASVAPGAPIVEPPACPSRALSQVSPNSWRPAREQLAPAGAAALRLCRYVGFNAPLPLALARSRLMTQQSLIAHLLGEFDTLPPFSGQPLSCPSDDGSQVVALLAYRGGERVTVELDRTGCNHVTNGDLVRMANGYEDMPVARRLQTELWKLTAPARGNAKVTALIRLCGGPPPVYGHPRPCFSQDGIVTVLDPAGEVMATMKTSHARFSFALPPGPYTLLATTGGARGQRTVVLTGGRTLQANVVVPIR